MYKFFRTACMLAVLIACALPARAAETFVLGVAPHTSARVILEMYRPLRQFLEEQLQCQVEIITAPDFTEYARRGLGQAYDLAVTTGHQARLFQTDAGYLPLLTYRADFRSVALVAAGGPVQALADLQGKKVLGLSASSLVTQWGQHWLENNRISMQPIIYVSASDSVAQQVAAGDAALGFTSLANYQKLPAELRARLKILVESQPMAGRVYLLNERRAAERKKIETALWAFAETAAAQEYFAANKLEGYRPLRAHELEEMDPYAAEVRRQLRAENP